MVSVFSRLRSRYISLHLSACLVIAVLTANLSSAGWSILNALKFFAIIGELHGKMRREIRRPASPLGQ
jgi:hypothetical protein